MSKQYIDFKMENNLLLQTSVAHETLDFHGNDLIVTEWEKWTEVVIEFEGEYQIKALVNNFNRSVMRGLGSKTRKDKVLELYYFYLKWKESTQPLTNPAYKKDNDYLKSFGVTVENAIAEYNYHYLPSVSESSDPTPLCVMEFPSITFIRIGKDRPERAVLSKRLGVFIDHEPTFHNTHEAYEFYKQRRHTDSVFEQQREEIREAQSKQLNIPNLFDLEPELVKAISLLPQFIAVCEDDLGEKTREDVGKLSHVDYRCIEVLLAKLYYLDNHVDTTIFE